MLVTLFISLGLRFLPDSDVQKPATLRETIARLEEVSRRKYAVVFAELGWSPDSTIWSRMISRRTKQLTSDVSIECIDFTPLGGEYKPFSDWKGWTEMRNKYGYSPIQGYGEVFWISNGEIIEMGRMPMSREQIITRTKEVFELP
jgi:hypothetical protein